MYQIAALRKAPKTVIAAIPSLQSELAELSGRCSPPYAVNTGMNCTLPTTDNRLP